MCGDWNWDFEGSGSSSTWFSVILHRRHYDSQILLNVGYRPVPLSASSFSAQQKSNRFCFSFSLARPPFLFDFTIRITRTEYRSEASFYGCAPLGWTGVLLCIFVGLAVGTAMKNRVKSHWKAKPYDLQNIYTRWSLNILMAKKDTENSIKMGQPTDLFWWLFEDETPVEWFDTLLFVLCVFCLYSRRIHPSFSFVHFRLLLVYFSWYFVFVVFCFVVFGCWFSFLMVLCARVCQFYIFTENSVSQSWFLVADRDDKYVLYFLVFDFIYYSFMRPLPLIFKAISWAETMYALDGFIFAFINW